MIDEEYPIEEDPYLIGLTPLSADGYKIGIGEFKCYWLRGNQPEVVGPCDCSFTLESGFHGPEQWHGPQHIYINEQQAKKAQHRMRAIR